MIKVYFTSKGDVIGEEVRDGVLKNPFFFVKKQTSDASYYHYFNVLVDGMTDGHEVEFKEIIAMTKATEYLEKNYLQVSKKVFKSIEDNMKPKVQSKVKLLKKDEATN